MHGAIIAAVVAATVSTTAALIGIEHYFNTQNTALVTVLCADIDECEERVLERCAGEHDICINTRGAHHCQTITCPDGFVQAPRAAGYTADRHRSVTEYD